MFNLLLFLIYIYFNILSNICMKDLTNRNSVRTFVVLCMSCYFLVAFVNVL